MGDSTRGKVKPIRSNYIDKYRVAANITEYHIISKLIFRRINTPKLFHVKNICENVKNQHVQNGRTDFCVTVIELLRFLHFTKLYQESSYRV